MRTMRMVRLRLSPCREVGQRSRSRRQWSIRSLASNPENRFSVRLFFTAMPSAFRCPISTTSFLPRAGPERRCPQAVPPHQLHFSGL